MNILLTGASGMLGSAVLIECLEDPAVANVIALTRKPLNRPHAKLKEVIISNFDDLTDAIKYFGSLDACFHCMGTSAVGLTEAEYTHTTYYLTKVLVDTLRARAPRITFVYVSGRGTDSSESGRVMWARVKGRTENLVLHAGFRDAYAFRPGVILPEKGVSSSTKWYNVLYRLMRPLYPLLRKSGRVTTSAEFGRAMIDVVRRPRQRKIVTL